MAATASPVVGKKKKKIGVITHGCARFFLDYRMKKWPSPSAAYSWYVIQIHIIVGIHRYALSSTRKNCFNLLDSSIGTRCSMITTIDKSKEYLTAPTLSHTIVLFGLYILNSNFSCDGYFRARLCCGLCFEFVRAVCFACLVPCRGMRGSCLTRFYRWRLACFCWGGLFTSPRSPSAAVRSVFVYVYAGLQHIQSMQVLYKWKLTIIVGVTS